VVKIIQSYTPIVNETVWLKPNRSNTLGDK
jgi:hypothetical protein